MSVKIGSSEWWTETANKVLDTGLSVIQTKLSGVDDTSGSTAVYRSAPSATNYLPYVIGAVLVGGIVLVLSKR